MEKLKRYLVLSEFDDTGHLIDSYDCFEEARDVAMSIFNFQQPKGDNEYHYEEKYELLTYKIHPTGQFMMEFPLVPHFETNGVYVAMVFDTYSVNNFSFKEFMFLRANTIYNYDLSQYCGEKRNIEIDITLFIAN